GGGDLAPARKHQHDVMRADPPRHVVAHAARDAARRFDRAFEPRDLLGHRAENPDGHGAAPARTLPDMFLEEIERALERGLRGVGVPARPFVAVEAVTRALIDENLAVAAARRL